MPEADPALKQEHMDVLSHEEHPHNHAPAEVQDYFAPATEHDHSGHVCAAECDHAPHEADHSANKLFGEAEAKHAVHGEAAHVHTAHCEHTHEHAETAADGLFASTAAHTHSHEKINHGEMGHVCAAECQHTHERADSLADNLFDGAEKQAAHSEHGHACDASCQHAPEQANEIAKQLFAEKPEQLYVQEFINTESSAKESQADNTNLEASRQAQVATYQQELVNVIAAEQAVEADAISSPDFNAGSSFSEKVENELEASEAETLVGNTAVNEEAPTRMLETTEAEVEAPNQPPVDEAISPQIELASEVPLASISDETLDIIPVESSLVAAEDSSEIVPIDLEAFDANPVSGTEIAEPNTHELSDGAELLMERISEQDDGIFAEPESAMQPTPSNVETAAQSPRKPETTEEILAVAPELEPIKELVPAIVETIVDSPDKANLIQEIQPIINELLRTFNDAENYTELTAETKAELREQLESLSLKLGLDTGDVLQSLEIDPENVELSKVLYEILHGLSKWLSLEYSLEFTSSQAKSTSVGADPRTLGQLILAMLQHARVAYA